jgi:hypothetical protein
MAGSDNTMKRRYNGIKPEPMDTSLPQKKPSVGVKPGMDAGQMRGNGSAERFGDPAQAMTASIRGMEGLHNDIGEMSGFVTDGYLDKQGTPYGEAAKFNYLPPGMDISNQMNAEIHEMPLKKLVAESYPGDGWMPAPRDITE